jgi:hypothetical protein
VAQPTDPALWERVKKGQRETSEGTPPGRWSARKAGLDNFGYESLGMQ